MLLPKLFMHLHCIFIFDISVGVGAFVIGLSQISSFFSYYLFAWCDCLSVFYIRGSIYKFLNVCPFDYTAVAGSGKVGTVNWLTTQVGWLYILQLIDLSRSAIVVQSNNFLVAFCVSTLPF